MKNTSPRAFASGGPIARAAAILFALSMLLFSACSQSDPRTAPIKAATPAEFDSWKISASRVLTREEIEEFDECANEIRLGIMQRREASGSGPIAAKLCEYINGKTYRDVLILGYKTTVEWVTKEIGFQNTNLKAYEEALQRPNLSEAARSNTLMHIRTMKDHLEKNLEPKLANAKKRLGELEKPGAKLQD